MHIVNPCFIKKAFFFLRILLKIDVSDRTDSFCRYPANCNINFWCRCSASAAIQLRKLVVRSTKSPAGAVQTAQWRELDLSSSRAPAESPVVIRCSVGSRNFVPRPLAVEPPTGRKNMRAPRPHTPRQVKITCTPANWFAVFKSFIDISKLWISEKIKFFSICHLHFSIFVVILIL